MADYFEWVRPWEKRDRDSKTMKWLRIEGVPMHAFNVKFLQLIANLHGTFVEVDDDTFYRRRLDVARVLIQAGRQARDTKLQRCFN